MTDYNKLKQLLSEFGIGFIEEPLTETKFYQANDVKIKFIKTIRLEVGNEKIDGYSGFSSEFYFDEHDKFIEVGIWE